MRKNTRDGPVKLVFWYLKRPNLFSNGHSLNFLKIVDWGKIMEEWMIQKFEFCFRKFRKCCRVLDLDSQWQKSSPITIQITSIRAKKNRDDQQAALVGILWRLKYVLICHQLLTKFWRNKIFLLSKYVFNHPLCIRLDS